MYEEYLELFTSYLESNNRSQNTVFQYKKELKTFFRFLEEQGVKEVKDIETYHVDMYQAKLMKKNKSVTVLKKISIMNSLFRYLFSRKHIKENPMDALDPIKVKDSDRKKKENLTVEESLRLIHSTEKNSIPTLKTRNQVLMMAFLFFGLRVSELCHLKVEHISFKNKTVYIVDGKGGKNREVPMFDELIPVFKAYIKDKKVKTEYFFTTKQTRRPLQPRAVLDLVKRHAKLAKINKNIGCHSLRRTSATLLLEDGLDPRKIQLYLGHSTISTTMLYLNPDLETTKEQIRKEYSLAKKLKKQMNEKK